MEIFKNGNFQNGNFQNENFQKWKFSKKKLGGPGTQNVLKTIFWTLPDQNNEIMLSQQFGIHKTYKYFTKDITHSQNSFTKDN